MEKPTCPICGGAGELHTIDSPPTAPIASYHAPGTFTAWITCSVCGFHGHHAIACTHKAGAARALNNPPIEKPAAAIERATAFFTAGRGANIPKGGIPHDKPLSFFGKN